MQKKVMVRLSQSPKTQDNRPKMQNGKQTTKMVTIILEYFVFQSCLISAFMHIVCVKQIKGNCYFVYYFTVLYMSSQYKFV